MMADTPLFLSIVTGNFFGFHRSVTVSNMRFSVRLRQEPMSPMHKHQQIPLKMAGTRTHTTFYSPRILSPVRLPFRHTGIPVFKASEKFLNASKKFVSCRLSGVKSNTSEGLALNQGSQRRFHVATFAKVLDGRKQPIRDCQKNNRCFERKVHCLGAKNACHFVVAIEKK